MKFTRSTFYRLLAAAALTASGAAMAAGNHAGGHGHGDGEETAIGKPGVAAKASRTITIEMSDTMRFTPERITAAPGEVLRLVLRNDGQVDHEMSVGTLEALMAHAQVMRDAAASGQPMHHHEGGSGSITVAPGLTREWVM